MKRRIKVRKKPCSMCGSQFKIGDKMYTNSDDVLSENMPIYCHTCAEAGLIGAPKQ